RCSSRRRRRSVRGSLTASSSQPPSMCAKTARLMSITGWRISASGPLGSFGSRNNRSRVRGSMGGLFQSGGGDATNEVPLPGHVDDQDRQDRNDRTGHDQVPLVLILPAERDQAELQVEHLGALHINEPVEKVVPHAGEGQDGGGQQGGARKGQDDLPEDAEPSHPIHDGGLFKVTRDALEELRHQQDVGGLKEVQD